MNIEKITTEGIIIDITNSIHGCLEQGGIAGRKVLLHWGRLASFGIKPGMNKEQIDDHLQEPINDHGTDGWDALEMEIEGGGYDKVLRKGRRIH